MLAKSKLDSIETLVSQALIDMEISHEEFNGIIGEKQKYERMKENVKKQENMRLNSVNLRKKNVFVNMRLVSSIEHLHHQNFFVCVNVCIN